MRLIGLILAFLCGVTAAHAQCATDNLSACPSPPMNTPVVAGLKVNITSQTFPASGNLVGTTDAQTLTNKIFSGGDASAATVTPLGGSAGTEAIGSVFARISNWRSPLENNALCNGTHDDAAAFNAALAANPHAVLAAPPGLTCKIGSTVTLADRQSIIGGGSTSSIILCATGASDCIAAAPNATGVQIKSLQISGSGLTGGNAIYLPSTVDAFVDEVKLFNVWNGIMVLGGNNPIVQNVRIQPINGAYGVKWDQDPANGASDQLTLNHVVINCGYTSGTDGVVWDGFTKTLNTDLLIVLQCRKGLWIENSRANAQFPQFLQMTKAQLEGFSDSAIVADSGSLFQITASYFKNSYGSSGQGNADNAVIQLNHDATTGASFNLLMSDSVIFGGGKNCLFVDWQNVYLSNNQMSLCSLSGSGTYPVAITGVHAGDVHFDGGAMGDATSSYSLQTTAGQGTTWLKNVTLTGDVTGPVNDLAGVLDHANQVQSVFISIASGTTGSGTFARPFAAAPALSCQQSGGSAGGAFFTGSPSTTSTGTLTQANSAAQAYNCTATGY